MHTRYRDRRHAGQVLAQALSHYAHRDDVVVLALPRGGVPVAFEIARALQAPLDVFIVRKLGVPGQPELAMGAIADGGVRVLNPDVVEGLAISPEAIDRVTKREQAELRRRQQRYRGDRPPPDVRDRVVILVDDGLATGATMRAAVEAIRRRGPRRVVVAVPVAAASTAAWFRNWSQVDEFVCPLTPDPFFGVGLWYDDFRQVDDGEVRHLLATAQALFSAQKATPTSDSDDDGSP